jgi:hypothetical protein
MPSWNDQSRKDWFNHEQHWWAKTFINCVSMKRQSKAKRGIIVEFAAVKN